jgi:adenylate kinase
VNKYVIMGIQGCGKGTQAKLLAEEFDLVHISVGDIFRWNIQQHTKLAARIKRIVAEGNLVPDDIVEDIVHRRLGEHDWNHGFILDGFPRNKNQARFFLESFDIDAVVNIRVTDQVVMERVLSRRLCEGCGLDYNLIHHRPQVPDVCDVCGGNLVARDDDTEAAVRKRIEEFHTKTRPVLDLFARKELVIHIDGTDTPEAVYADLKHKLGLH